MKRALRYNEFLNEQENKRNRLEEDFLRFSKIGDYANMKKCLDAGVNVNAQDNEGWTALMYNSKNGYVDGVNLLIENGADVNILNLTNDNAIYRAVLRNKIEVVKILIDSGAQIDNLEDNIFILAAERGFKEIVILLLEAGADYTKKDIEGKNALDWAIKMNRKEVIDILKNPDLYRLTKKLDSSMSKSVKNSGIF